MWTSKFPVLASIISPYKWIIQQLVLYISLISFINVSPPLRGWIPCQVLIKSVQNRGLWGWGPIGVMLLDEAPGDISLSVGCLATTQQPLKAVGISAWKVLPWRWGWEVGRERPQKNCTEARILHWFRESENGAGAWAGEGPNSLPQGCMRR